jgi:hypothetical protein
MRARTTLLVTALTLAASSAGASIAVANPGPTGDQGLVGACNMTNTNAEYGMFTISQFAANSPQGSSQGWNGGMITAISITNPNDVGNCGGSPVPRP